MGNNALIALVLLLVGLVLLGALSPLLTLTKHCSRRSKSPSPLFWGTDDGITPSGDAIIMEREIPGIRHGVHRDRAREIAMVIAAGQESEPRKKKTGGTPPGRDGETGHCKRKLLIISRSEL